MSLDNGEVVVRNLRVADTFWSRLCGLLPRKGLPRDEGLLLTHCGSVHTFFMRFPIDVVYLDRDMRAVAVFHDVMPWRIVPGLRGTVHTLELPVGTLAATGIRAGDRVTTWPRCPGGETSRVS